MPILHYLIQDNNLKQMTANKINLPLRAVAAKIITIVLIEQKSLSTALTLTTDHLLSDKELSLVKELCFGTIRWYFRLDNIASQLIKIPLKAKDQDIYALILIGIYQLIYLRIAQHAAVSETVAAAYALKKPWAAKLINGVLRQYIRNSENLISQSDNFLTAQYAHPQWFIENIQNLWPDYWRSILESNNCRPPFSCRINAQHYSRDEYIKLLNTHNISANTIEFTTHGIILDKPCDVHELPGFSAGSISIQDGAAQLAANLLALENGQRVLDACAAPGGKTMHILETQADLGKLIALDIEEQRLLQVQENLNRLHIEFRSPSSAFGTFSREREKEKHGVELIVGDAGSPDLWWDKQLFDRILCDAPCSSTGVIRRHPDIKILRRLTDIEQLMMQQWQILNALWPMLKPGGILLYCTCSILPAENSELMQRFLAEHPDAQEKIIDAKWGLAQKVGRQILTGMHNMDGFYFAKIIKYPIN